jgi:DNA-binding IclR family transcriptional regulator
MAWMFERADAVAVHLAILRGPDVVYLDKLSRPEGARLPSRIGGRFPATCTALGKSMLAFSDGSVVRDVVSGPLARPTPYSVAERRRLHEQLEQARITGYAVDHEEACRGTVCIAAPIMQDGHAIAALSLCVPTYGISHAVPDRTAGYGRIAVDAASAVARLVSAH